MERISKGIYTPEFRAEVVKLVEKEGLPVDAAAKRLSVPKSSLGNWVRASRKGNWGDYPKRTIHSVSRFVYFACFEYFV